MIRIKSVFLSIAITAFSNPVFSACDTTLAGDGILVFGSNASTSEFTNLQTAINMARECEFQISSFTTQPTSAANVLADGFVSNLDEVNSPWKNGVDEIEEGDLIQFNSEGKWYEIDGVTSNEIHLTREVDLGQGSYSYAVTKPMRIVVNNGSYVISDKLNFSGIHYLTLAERDVLSVNSVKPALHLTQRSNFKSAPEYGQLTIDGLQLISSSEALLFLGNPVDTVTSDLEHDIDLTISDSVLMNTNGFDAIKSNYHGDTVIVNSHLQSKNDVIFLPYNNSFDKPRSVTIDHSVFISSARVDGDFDAGNKKVITMQTRENGYYSINNSVISVYKQPNGSPRGVGIKVTSNVAADVQIDNVNVVCNACAGTPSADDTTPLAGILLIGAGGTYSVSNSQILVDSASCGISAASGAVVQSVNNTWASSSAPYCTHQGGVIY